MNNKKRIDRLKRLSVLIGLSTALSLVECCNKNNNKTFDYVMESVSDETCFDEVAGDELIDSVNELESYIDLSNELSKLYLDDVNYDLSNYKLRKPEEISTLIDNYDRNNTIDLCIQNKLVNNYIRNYGYNIMDEAILNGIKSRIADLGDIDSLYVDNIDVMDRKTFNAIMSSGYAKPLLIGNLDISRNKDFINLLISLYDMQENVSYSKEYDKNIYYNKGRNKLIKNAIDNLKKIYSNEYKLDNKKRIKKI